MKFRVWAVGILTVLAGLYFVVRVLPHPLLSILAVITSLPVYFHVLLLVNLGLWCWATNIHILNLSGINSSLLLEYSPVAQLRDRKKEVDVKEIQMQEVAELTKTSDDELLTSGKDKIPNKDVLPTHTVITPPPLHSSSSSFALSHTRLYRMALYFSLATFSILVAFTMLERLMGWDEERSEIVVGFGYSVMLLWLASPFLPPIPALSKTLRMIPFVSRLLDGHIGGGYVLVGDMWYSNERTWFGRSLRRIAFDGIRSPVPFCDVILADILTSYSRVLGELHLVVSDLLYSTDHNHTQSGGFTIFGLHLMELIGPALVSLPFLFRFRQCIAEYLLTPYSSDSKSGNSIARRRHLGNAAKYASSFPVIVSSLFVNWVRIASRAAVSQEVVAKAEDIQLWASWINFAISTSVLFSVINTVFSLYWDIIVDWRLGPQRIPAYRLPTPAPVALQQSSWLASRPLHYKPQIVYLVAIFVDTLLRLAWVPRVLLVRQALLKVLGIEAESYFPPLAGLAALDLGLKALEIIRRWMWVFFRVEREWVITNSGL